MTSKNNSKQLIWAGLLMSSITLTGCGGGNGSEGGSDSGNSDDGRIIIDDPVINDPEPDTGADVPSTGGGNESDSNSESDNSSNDNDSNSPDDVGSNESESDADEESTSEDQSDDVTDSDSNQESDIDESTDSEPEDATDISEDSASDVEDDATEDESEAGNNDGTATNEENASDDSTTDEPSDDQNEDLEQAAQFAGQLVITSQWDSGYGAEIKITNQSLSALENWQLRCESSLDITSLWNADYQASNGTLSLTPVSWNSTLSASQSLTIGFGANGSLPENALTNCDLSGFDIQFAQVDAEAPLEEEEGNNDSQDEQPEVPDTSGDVVLMTDLVAAEAALTSGELMALVKQAIATRDNATVEAVDANNPENPENVKRVEAILSEADWDYVFPRRADEYTYRKFLQAVAKFPAFCGPYDDGRDAVAICRKSLATMFAHFTQETGGHTSWWPEEEWRQGLHYLREVGWSEDMANGYGICDPNTWQAKSWPCATYPEGHPQAGQYKSYFGRGSKQLSYNYNYGPFSQAMFGDVNVLLQNPELVADTWLNLASAVFFFVYPQPPKPSMLHVIDGTWQPNANDLAAGLVSGFGVTTQIINGGIECGGSSEHIQSQNRINYYQAIANYLSVSISESEVLGCANMQQFDSNGAGALAIYWEQSWTQENACQLVGYQTAFSAFMEGDYAKCVDHYFDVEIVEVMN
ncbi:MAG: cellulose binding domain-containing protein [Pseudomonadales bacterium]|nr:cellulose binding domain-containing protein [Pseudomonadales bacterium]